MGPSTVPSSSSEPSYLPSEEPSFSSSPSSSGVPSNMPSATPSVSMGPSTVPSSSSEPSYLPSEEPSFSFSPSSSFMPSSAPSPACIDRDDWYYTQKDNKRHCDHVAERPDKRCDKEGDDLTLAYESCPVTCGTCPVITGGGDNDGECTDDPTWTYIKKDKTKDCTDIAKKDTQKRCENEIGIDDRIAKDACVRTCKVCTLSPTSSPTSLPSSGPSGYPTNEFGEPDYYDVVCEDDPSWHYTDKKGKTKDCTHIADKADDRCTQVDDKYLSDDLIYSYDGCPLSCGKCTVGERRALYYSRKQNKRVKGQ